MSIGGLRDMGTHGYSIPNGPGMIDSTRHNPKNKTLAQPEARFIVLSAGPPDGLLVPGPLT
jgi:hypothetical protein